MFRENCDDLKKIFKRRWKIRRFRFSTHWMNICVRFYFNSSQFLFHWIRANFLNIKLKIKAIKNWSLKRSNFNSIFENEVQRKIVRIYIRWFFKSVDSFLITELTLLLTRFLLNNFKRFEFKLDLLSMTLFNIIFWIKRIKISI